MSVISRFLGYRCKVHDVWHKSDFCPQCLRQKLYGRLHIDDSKEWVRAEGSWPIRSKAS